MKDAADTPLASARVYSTKAAMTSFIARERERQWLAEELTRSAAGRGRVALIQGEAGIGKSRLLQETIDPAQWRIFIGCAERDGAPYAHVAQILRQGLRVGPAVLVRIHHLRPRLANVLPELGAAAPCDAADLRSVLCAALAALADEAPTALVLEDLHGADAATIELLPALAAMQAHRPFALIATLRDEPLPSGHVLLAIRATLRQQSRLRDLRLGTLTGEAIAAVADGILGGALHPSLSAWLAARAGGVPLFVEELTRTLRDLGRVRVGAQGWELLGGDDLPVPEGIRDAVTLRLDGCADAVRTTLHAAAIADRDADRDVLTRLLVGEPPLDEACATGLVTCDGERLRWRHDLLREAVAAEVPWSKRRAWHSAIAEVLSGRSSDAALVARHHEQAGNTSGARRAWLQAGSTRSRVFAHRDAMTALQRAVAAWPAKDSPSERRQAFAALGAAALSAGEAAEAARAWREVLDQRDETMTTSERARAWRALAVATSLQGAWHQSIAARQEAMAAFTAAGEAGEAVTDHYAIGGHLLAQRKLDDARHTLQAASERAHHAGVVGLEARILGSLATAISMLGDARAAQTLVERALRLALDANETAAAADVYRRIGTLHEMSSNYAAACDAYETALGFCRTQTLPGAARTCMGCMTWALFLAGDWKRAQTIVREVTDDPQSPNGSRSVGHLVAGLMAVLRGQPRAVQELARSEELARLDQIHSILWGVAWGRALLAETTGDFSAAAGFYRTSISDWETSDDLVEMVPVLAQATVCFSRLGDRAWLDRTVAGMRRCADRMANPETLAGLARALGEQALGDGRISDARAHFAQALDLLDDGGLVLDRVQTAWRAGHAALLAGDRAGAALLARSGRAIAGPLKAQLWLDRLRELPDDGEATPRLDDHTLTSRQLDVLRLLAKGCTNRRIGELLGLSSRTVDMHVARILDRLGAGTRTEAALLAEEQGLLG